MFAEKIEGRVAVIGDVHGQADKLWTILERLKSLPDFSERWLVFVGDLVDRGPDSKAVMSIITDLLNQHRKVTSICGNHDLAMAASLGIVDTPDYANWATRWINHYDSHTTFESYGVQHGDLESLRSALPDSHAQMLASMPWCVEHPQYLFVHAGLDSFTPYDMQLGILREKDFSLTRPQWLCDKKLVHSDLPADCPVSVVSGHVTMPQVVINRKRILCDTTGGRSGDLSCVLLPENVVVSSGSNQQTHIAARKEQPAKAWWKVW